jgi:hypothetical protein
MFMVDMLRYESVRLKKGRCAGYETTADEVQPNIWRIKARIVFSAFT